MGKIFDALEKARRESLLINKGLVEQTQYKEQSDEEKSRITSKVTLPQVSYSKQNKRFFIGKKKKRLGNIDFFITEQFKRLKTKIIYTNNGDPPRTILVTSALPLEGKSMVAANLALCLAQGVNEHSLLVDCDFRKPSLHKLFGLAPGKGLTDYLSENTDLPSILLKTDTPKLSLLPVGKKPLNPLDLLASKKMKNLVQELKAKYNNRYIIFDSSPIQVAAETTLLLSQVDGIILVVRANKTEREIVLKVVHDIDKKKLLGIVLNCLKGSILNQQYYYRHY